MGTTEGIDLSKIKSKGDISDKAVSVRDYPEIKEVGIKETKKMPKSLKERFEQRQKNKLKKLQKKHTYMQKKYGAKLEIEKLKADIAQMKATQRKSSFGHAIGEAITRVKQKGTTLKERESIESARLKRAQLREREEQRKGIDYEREYHRKFSVRTEGDGELPYYEKEEGRKLTPPCKPESPKIGITNGERIPKKKSLKDELF